VANQTFADLVTGMEDVDLADLALRPIGRPVPEEIPHLFHGRV
jgi:hypothetical protein